MYLRAKSLMPGGTQLLSKRPEMYLPDQWPAYASRASGVDIWDLDDSHYVDMTTTAIAACPLGFADPDVNDAVKLAIDAASMTTLNCPEEVELAELLVTLHPWAEQVRFARGGGEAMAIAVRIARAATGRSTVAFSGYHGWHDWYLAANLANEAALDGHLLPGLDPTGVPRSLAGSALPFQFNSTSQFDAIINLHGSELAAVIIEPTREHLPEPGFLEHLRDRTSQVGAALIFDEVSAGWRLAVGGSHLLFGVEPDIAVFAKAISNGFPMAAVIGRRVVMEAAQRSFISSTYWTEKIGPVAALTTIRKLQQKDGPAYFSAIGRLVRDGWSEISHSHGLPIAVHGHPAFGGFSFVDEQGGLLASSFTQGMLEKGYLANPAFCATLAHTDQHIQRYLEHANDVFGVLSALHRSGRLDSYLHGPIAHDRFRRLT